MSDEFETTNAGASDVRPIQAGAVKKGSFVMLKGRPCKVVEYTTSKTGKHGHAKASIVGIDIFTGKKLDENCPTSHNMDEPVVTRNQYQLVGWEDTHITLMDTTGKLREDLTWPINKDGKEDKCVEDWKKQVESGKDVFLTVVSACKEEKVLGANEK